MTDDEQAARCGFVSVVGLPNAGKSTLVNALVGAKVSIVSRKVQTTRCRILGIVMCDQTQIVLMDTPGIFDPQRPLEKAMVEAALQTLGEADLVMLIVDAAKKNAAAANEEIISRLPENKPVILVLNKIDQVNKPDLLALADTLGQRFSFEAVFMVSALKENGIRDIRGKLAAFMPSGPFLYDPEQITDLPVRFIAAEITREKIFDQLHQELPYSIFVETESWEQADNGRLDIGQVIYVQRESQKGIVLGKGGAQIKKIGQAARKDLEDFLEARVHLNLFVKLRENWTGQSENYRILGLQGSDQV